MDIFSTSTNPCSLDLEDAIHNKIQKSKAILTSVMFASEFIRNDMPLDNNTVYHALWAVDDYLAEIETLVKRFSHSPSLKS